MIGDIILYYLISQTPDALKVSHIEKGKPVTRRKQRASQVKANTLAGKSNSPGTAREGKEGSQRSSRNELRI